MTSTSLIDPRIESLTTDEISKLREQAKGIKISLLEKAIVNVFTPPDLILHGSIASAANKLGQHFEEQISGSSYEKFLRYMMQPPKGTFSERAQRMWDGKNDDYKMLIAMQENLGGIPPDIKKVYQLSPCGAAKLAALYVRKDGRINGG